MNDDPDDDDPVMQEVWAMATQIVTHGHWPSRRALDALFTRRGALAVYDLGRIVGQMQLAEAVHLAARDGWDAEVALRSREGRPTRKGGET